jgi:dihydropyrimidinase
MALLIAGGTVVTADDELQADVLVEGERIAAVGHGLSADRVIDATGKYVIPGGVDVHTHMDTLVGGVRSSDDFETGTIAAAFGGTTTIVDFAAAGRGHGVQASLAETLARAEGKAAIDYGLHMILTEMTDQVMADMDRLIRDEGVTSFKLFMAYKDLRLDDEGIFRAMQRAAGNGGLISMHAENGGVIDTLVEKALAEGQTAPMYHALTRPPRGEAEATGRAIALAEIAGVPIYIVHLSCAEALDAVREARDRGLPAYAETCPQYLFLSLDDLSRPDFEGAKYVCSPPLRAASNHEELWDGLAEDDLQVVATDHCPFCFVGQKDLGRGNFARIPNGLPGVEHRMSLLYDGGVRARHMTMSRYVQLTATAPAKVFGLYPRKGAIAVGSDADLVIFDPDARATISAASHHMRTDYNPYEGRQVTGLATTVLARGKVIVDGGKYLGIPGDGRYLKRGLFQPPS